MKLATKPSFRAFTIVELLVVIAIVTLLIGILLPAINRARSSAQLSLSQSNLRNLSAAHANYSAQWNDRHLTFTDDALSSYGSNIHQAVATFAARRGEILGTNPGDQRAWHPSIELGWGYNDAGTYLLYQYWQYPSAAANHSLLLPITMDEVSGPVGFGSFRLGNARAFHKYLSGRLYDKVFFAPRDELAVEAARPCFDDPSEYCSKPDLPEDQAIGDIPVWTSYVLSPAAMFNPDVMRRNDPSDPAANGYRDPFSLAAGLRTPSMSQATYPSLKTHMLEHHWLQNRKADCNGAFNPGTFVGGCEPYYFNHSWDSTPATLFFDGHIEMVGVRRASQADARAINQSGVGLWSRDTPLGEDGYYIGDGYDQAATSFHILTTDGIRGRDLTSQ